jgi:hypothetical protein
MERLIREIRTGSKTLFAECFFLVLQENCGNHSLVSIVDATESLMVEDRCPLLLQVFSIETLHLNFTS